MPRGLGDDPLARKRGRKSKSSPSQDLTDEPSSERAADPLQQDTATTLVLSHNDVFFKRRGEVSSPTEEDVVAQQPDRVGPDGRTDPAKIPEISEAFDIVRIAEVVQSTQTVKAKETKQLSEDSTVSIPSIQRADEPVVTSEPQQRSTLEDDRTSESLPRGFDELIVTADETPSRTNATPIPSSATHSAQTNPENEVRPDEKRKGILNRLFGRFGR